MSKPSKIRLVLLDLGGTLLNDNNKISIKNRNMIHKIKKKFNVKIALATARMYSSTKYISKKIKADYAIFSNGSIIIKLYKWQASR